MENTSGESPEPSFELLLEVPAHLSVQVKRDLEDDLQKVLRKYFPEGRFHVTLNSKEGKIILRVALVR